jgi:hypothetical protein
LFRISDFGFRILTLCLLLLVCGCKKETPAQRAAGAQALLEQTTKEYHTPSENTNQLEQVRLLKAAAANYRKILSRYPEQTHCCAQALRLLGNIEATRTNLPAALKCYAGVGEKYPADDWEVLQAWRSAADLLWEANRTNEARLYYQKVVQRFDGTNQPPVIRLVVKGAKAKLAPPPAPTPKSS